MCFYLDNLWLYISLKHLVLTVPQKTVQMKTKIINSKDPINYYYIPTMTNYCTYVVINRSLKHTLVRTEGMTVLEQQPVCEQQSSVIFFFLS